MFIIAIVIIAVLIVFFYLSGDSAPKDKSLLSIETSSEVDVASSQVLSLLNQIKSLKIDNSLFSDPSYNTLRDYSVAVPPLNVGRQNPFAPISGFSPALPNP